MKNNNCNGCNDEVIQQGNGALEQFERNKYFYGKLMTVRDFEVEQRYFNEKRHLLNRLIHGVGIVCGLEVSNLTIEGEVLNINLSPGVALDCWGREIVVDKDYPGVKVIGTFDTNNNKGYLYIKQKPCLKDRVPVLANASTCEQECCYSRIKEDFEVVLTNTAPSKVEDIRAKYYDKEKGTITSPDECPPCTCNDPKVLLAVINKGGTVDDDETHKYRSIVYNNPMLYDLITSHLTNFNNPHKVKALMSVNGVGNAEGKEWVENIDLISPDNSITIDPKPNEKKIDIKLPPNLNADTVDGKHAEAFALVGHTHEDNTYISRLYTLKGEGKEEIPHNFGRYPVVDVYGKKTKIIKRNEWTNYEGEGYKVLNWGDSRTEYILPSSPERLFGFGNRTILRNAREGIRIHLNVEVADSISPDLPIAELDKELMNGNFLLIESPYFLKTTTFPPVMVTQLDKNKISIKNLQRGPLKLLVIIRA